MSLLPALSRLPDYVQHVVFALAIQIAWAVVFGAVGLVPGYWCFHFVIGAIAATHQFYGRKHRDKGRPDGVV